MSSQIDEIKSRVDIAELIGSYLKLTRAGANFKALCPFHGEKTPSFNVSPARQMWHCFGCGKGGDIFTFVEEMEGLEFVDVLKMLAERAGVELRKEDPQLRSERNRLMALTEEATKFFEEQLITHHSSLNYLKFRGLADETIQEFRLGYAPDDWRALFAHLKSKGFSDKELEKSGLVVKSGRDASTYYDRFRGRIIFPIFDYNGRAVAFGGRIFPEKNNEAKYINSPETALYQKSRILYGINKSKQEILKTGECVLVEGYMDLIMSWQAGVKNAVAVSGTALTEEQLKSLRRLSEKLIVAFDMDEAGEGAARRGISLALAAGFAVKVAGKYGFKDPAEAVAKDPEIWKGAVNKAQHIIRFYIDSVLKKHSADTPEAKREFQKTVLPFFAYLSELERAHWAREASEILNIKEEAIWSALGKINNPGSEENAPADDLPKNHTRKDLLEAKILGIAAMYPALEEKIDPVLASILPQTNRAAFFAELFLNSIVEAEAELMACQKALKKEYLKEKLSRISSEIAVKEKSENRETETLLTEFKKITDELSRL